MGEDRDAQRTAQPRRETPLFPERNPDDKSGHAHRQLIGLLGAALPLMVWFLDRIRPTPGLEPVELTSISAYHYTAGVITFAGILSALAVYLIAYDGYATVDGWKDRLASSVAGGAAVLVALFPTDPPGDTPDPSWWDPWIGRLHYGAAILLFVMFIYFCLFRFPKSGEKGFPWRAEARDGWDREKWLRNILYAVSGIGIAVALILAWGAGKAGRSIFVHETVALELFALSWLVKGKADRTALAAVKLGSGAVRHPIEAAGKARQAVKSWAEP